MPLLRVLPSDTFADGAPTKELLDSAVSDRPVLCQDHSEHSHWVNSRMLELMGITAETPDPVPGLEVFERDTDGEPTGHLREWSTSGSWTPCTSGWAGGPRRT